MTAAVIDMAQARDARMATDIRRRVSMALPIWIRMQDDLRALRRIHPSIIIREALAEEWARQHGSADQGHPGG